MKTSLLVSILIFCACQNQPREAKISTCFEAANAVLYSCTRGSDEPCPNVFKSAFEACITERADGQPVCYKDYYNYWYCVAPTPEIFVEATTLKE